MPRRKAKVADPSVVPESVQKSRVYQRQKVTKRTLPSFNEAMMLIHAPEVFRQFWQATLASLRAGDKDIIKMVAEGIGYIKGGGGGGFTLNQNILNQNAVAGVQSPVMGYDAFARQLAETRAGHAIAMPQVVDAIPVDTPPADAE